jgi:hypothetical protein
MDEVEFWLMFDMSESFFGIVWLIANKLSGWTYKVNLLNDMRLQISNKE